MNPNTPTLASFFGDLAPAILATLVAVLTQKIKEATGWTGWKVEVLNLLMNYGIFLPYHVITTFLIYDPAEMTIWAISYVVFQGVVYPLMGWVYSAGYYQKFIGSSELRRLSARALRGDER